VASLCHPWFTTTNLSYRFPIFETSATALCGTTGRDTKFVGWSWKTCGFVVPGGIIWLADLSRKQHKFCRTSLSKTVEKCVWNWGTVYPPKLLFEKRKMMINQEIWGCPIKPRQTHVCLQICIHDQILDHLDWSRLIYTYLVDYLVDYLWII
jgi:hypothetical protein